MSAEWCTQIYEQTLEKWGAPEIVNTDQGSQYTSEIFISAVRSTAEVQLRACLKI